jgi:hypothetical protein
MWYRFLDQASDEELETARVSLKADLEWVTYPDARWEINWRNRRLREEIDARAQLARLRQLYSAS